MRKLISLLSVLLFVFIAVTGCSKATDEKMCRIEITDSNNKIMAELENQSQADITEFFDESGWKETNISTDNLAVEYVISVYQEKTKTVIKTDNNDEYEKIMEYVTFENSDVVKVSIGGDIVGGMVENDILDEYYIASSDFFSRIEGLTAMASV